MSVWVYIFFLSASTNPLNPHPPPTTPHTQPPLRFDGVRDAPLRFFSFWMIQGLWVILCGLPVFTINSYPLPSPKPLDFVDYIGWAIWVLGFGIEVVADNQKARFAAKKTGTYIDEGLWYYSRHPNYFGEILLWIGIFVGSSRELVDAQWAVVVSPIFIWFLLTKVSGVPLLEKKSDVKFAGDNGYLLYKKNTAEVMLWFKGTATEFEDVSGGGENLLASTGK